MKVRALQRCLLSVSVVMRFKFEQCDNKGPEQKHPASIQGGEALCIFSFSGKFYLVTLSQRNWEKSCKTVQEKKISDFYSPVLSTL